MLYMSIMTNDYPMSPDLRKYYHKHPPFMHELVIQQPSMRHNRDLTITDVV